MDFIIIIIKLLLNYSGNRLSTFQAQPNFSLILTSLFKMTIRLLRLLPQKWSTMPHGQYRTSLYSSENKMEVSTFFILKNKNILRLL